jgi:hypothetical protein
LGWSLSVAFEFIRTPFHTRNLTQFVRSASELCADFGACRNLLASRRLVDFTHAVCYWSTKAYFCIPDSTLTGG